MSLCFLPTPFLDLIAPRCKVVPASYGASAILSAVELIASAKLSPIAPISSVKVGSARRAQKTKAVFAAWVVGSKSP